MKKSAILVIWALLLAFATSAQALEVPKLKGYVNDYADMLTAEQSAQISRDLELYANSTSTQIFILTIPSLEGEVIEQFSIKVAEVWKAGQKDKDNGILITLAKAEHKIRIEVGLGLEGTITDLVSGRIIREEMSPKLKEGKADIALLNAVAKIKAAIKGEYKGSEEKPVDGNAKATKEKESNALEIKWAATAITFLIVAGIASAVHFLLGGAAGAIIALLFATLMWHLAISGIIISGIVGFVLGMIAKELGFIGLQLGAGVLGGGGSFGGGGASGDW
jgi:uncharacterized protein